jgi:hypothetical protein
MATSQSAKTGFLCDFNCGKIENGGVIMVFQRSVPVQLDTDEKVVRNLRRHGAILAGRILPPFVVLLAPLTLIVWALFIGGRDPGQAHTMFTYSLAALLVLGLPMLGWAALNAWDWSNDSFHITTKRVIRSERNWWFSQNVISAGLGQIQNIAVFIPDLLANALNYGTVVIETAAQVGKIEFDSVYDPRAVQRLLFELRGVPPPPDEPALPAWTSLRDVIVAIFPFAPQHKSDGSVTYHKHWFILAQALGVPLFLLLMVMAGAWLLRSSLPLLALLAVLPMLVYQYVNWVNDIYILTNNRIIDIMRIPLIKQDRREALLEQIQNVQVTVPNVGSQLLDMGDVFVETAGKAENFLFKTVHHPAAVAEELSRRLDAIRSGRKQAEKQAQMREIEAMITQILQTQQGASPPSDGAPPQV